VLPQNAKPTGCAPKIAMVPIETTTPVLVLLTEPGVPPVEMLTVGETLIATGYFMLLNAVFDQAV
jgi:hypothetical protein